MTTIRFQTEKHEKGMLLLFPTVLVDTSQKKEKARIAISFTWLCGSFNIGIEWTRITKIAANTTKDK